MTQPWVRPASSLFSVADITRPRDRSPVSSLETPVCMLARRTPTLALRSLSCCCITEGRSSAVCVLPSQAAWLPVALIAAQTDARLALFAACLFHPTSRLMPFGSALTNRQNLGSFLSIRRLASCSRVTLQHGFWLPSQTLARRR